MIYHDCFLFFYGLSMKKFFVFLVSFVALSFTFAFAGNTSTTESKIVSPDRVPPVQTAVQYIFNETGVKNMVTKNNTLLQVNCNTPAILTALGFGSSAQKIFTVGLEENGYEYNFDVKNCSLWWNKVNANYSYTKSITEQQALTFADAFIATSYLRNKVYMQVGKAIVVYKNSNGPMYAMAKETSSSLLSDIEIDPTDTGADILPEYTSISILYPYLINGQEVRDQYGNRAGIQLEVSADGVMSVNARLLLFKWANRNSEKISGDDAVRILKNGGNSPFYTQTTTKIKFAAPQKVLVLFSLRRDNKNYQYLSSWIGLKSSIKLDQRAQQPYSMILSDYKIWNNAQ